MDFGFTPQQEMIRNEAAAFLSRECAMPLVRELMVTEHSHSETLWDKMASMGWMGLIFPEQYDGAGLSFVELSILMEQMGAVLMSGPYFSTVVLAGLTLLESASDSQKERWLTPLARGNLKATLALTESDGRCAVSSPTVRAERDGKDYLISGTKLFVPDAQIADLIICWAAQNSGKDLMLVVVDRDSEGLTITPLKTMDQTRRLYEVTFKRVRIGRDRVLEGYSALERVLDRAAIALSAQMIGGARRVLEMCVEFSKTRIQFGRPIGSFQAIQHRCADMLLLVESARSAVYAASCNAAENKGETGLLASIAKAYTSDAYSWIAGEGIQIHGGMGFTFEHDAHLYFKRAKADEFMFGDSNFHLDRVADYIGL